MNAIPPGVCPVTNKATDAMNTKPDTTLNKPSDAEMINENSADATVRTSANGTAISFRMSLINLTNPSKFSVFTAFHALMLTLFGVVYKAVSKLFSISFR